MVRYIYSWIVKHLNNAGPFQTSTMELFTKMLGNVNLKLLDA